MSIIYTVPCVITSYKFKQMPDYSNLDLFLQSPHTQLPNHLKFSKVLHLLRFFLQHTIETFESLFLKREFTEIDPHVGETACQIRAYLIMCVSLNTDQTYLLSISKKIDRLRSLCQKVNNDLMHYTQAEKVKRNKREITTLLSFLADKNYLYTLTEQELFLVKARILTTYKQIIGENEIIIDYTKLVIDMEVAKDAARRLIHQYQIDLSSYSCEFIYQLADKLKFNPISSNLLKQFQRFDEEKRAVLPCYLTMLIILHDLYQSKKNILLVIKNNAENQVVAIPFINSTGISDYRNSIFYVLSGTTQYSLFKHQDRIRFTETITKVGLCKIIMLNMAAHPQYSGRKLAFKCEDPFMDLINNLDIKKKTLACMHYIKSFLTIKLRQNYWDVRLIILHYFISSMFFSILCKTN